MSALVSHSQEHRGTSPRKSASIIRGVPFSKPPTVEDALEEAAEIMWRAFPADSRDACAKKAAACLGVDRTTIIGILSKETKNPSWPLLRRALEEIKDPWELPAIRRFIFKMMAKGAK